MFAIARSPVLHAPSRFQRGTYAVSVPEALPARNQCMTSQVVETSADQPWAELCRSLKRPAMLLATVDDPS